jgi:flagellar biosynthesis protein FlhF
VIALVGPTGVGKTTTLAKLATHADLYGRKRVALVSADTYRIAAVEQLKTFAAIANIPMEAVYRPGDIGRAIERFGDRDVILIDTAGRSQNDGGSLRELAAFMEYAGADEVHLVLSMSTRLEDQLDVISKFSAADPKALIFTKLDETTNYGMILNVCYHLSPLTPLNKGGNKKPMPISLLTCGQNVPDDVARPSQAQLVRLVCERTYYPEILKAQD